MGSQRKGLPSAAWRLPLASCIATCGTPFASSQTCQPKSPVLASGAAPARTHACLEESRGFFIHIASVHSWRNAFSGSGPERTQLPSEPKPS